MASSPASTISPLQRLSTFKTPKTPSSASPLDTFAADPIFSAFLSPSFSSTSFSSGSPASTAEKLQHAIRLLESQLRSEVLSRHSDLASLFANLLFNLLALICFKRVYVEKEETLICFGFKACCCKLLQPQTSSLCDSFS